MALHLGPAKGTESTLYIFAVDMGDTVGIPKDFGRAWLRDLTEDTYLQDKDKAKDQQS